MIGGKVKYIAVGSAAITEEILDFIAVYFGCVPVEGFGMTECYFTNTRHTSDLSPGSLGPPSVQVEQKLVSVPDLGYFVTDTPYPRGELLIRGALVTSGYYKEPQLSSQLLNSDGWLHTGDIAVFKPNGTIAIIDRVKNLFKLSIGEYISPEKIEGIIGRSHFVSQSLVYGTSGTNFIVAVVVPEPTTIIALAKSLKVVSDDASPTNIEVLATISASQTVTDAVYADIHKNFVGGNIPHYEIVKAISLSLVPLTVENGALTPTLKVRRKVAQELYKKNFEALIAKVGAQKQ